MTASNLNELGFWMAAETLLTPIQRLPVRRRTALRGAGGRGQLIRVAPAECCDRKPED